jgi:hypothetical protein
VPDLLAKGVTLTESDACGPSQGPFDLGRPTSSSPESGNPSISEVDIGMLTSHGTPVGEVIRLYASGRRAVVYGPHGRRAAHLDLGRESISRFAIAGNHAVLSTDQGHVFVSDDGGYSWTRDD